MADGCGEVSGGGLGGGEAEASPRQTTPGPGFSAPVDTPAAGGRAAPGHPSGSVDGNLLVA